MNSIFDIDEKLLINTHSQEYSGKLPFFYDPKDFPALEIISNNWQLILEEIVDYERNFGKVRGLDTYLPPSTSSEIAWSNIYLENFMWRFWNNRKYFPKTCNLLNAIPDCTLAAISILSPKSIIKPHYGDTNGIIRVHLGLSIPKPYPTCGIKVASEERGWKDGELTIFSEAHLHSTWNNSDDRRYLLVFDIVHPKWRKNKLYMCSLVLGAQSFVYFENRIPILKKMPKQLVSLVCNLFTIVWLLYIPIQRKLGGLLVALSNPFK